MNSRSKCLSPAERTDAQMDLDDKICYCYHVPLRKLRNFALRTRLARPSQMSECLGAGTGCGWCIPVLKKIYEECQAEDAEVTSLVDMTPDQYATARDHYRKTDQPKNSF